jgi:flagellar basal-body rod protein FlgG
LDAQQTQLDVVTNNLANVGATEFQAQPRCFFEDLMYQNLRQWRLDSDQT